MGADITLINSEGIFVQWVVSVGIFCVGMAVYAMESFPSFHPLAMLGGSLWALGNATSIPIMNVLGLGMGMLIWGVTNCVTGWAVGRYGLFGVNASIPTWPLLNYFGLVLVLIGCFLFSQMRPTAFVVREDNNVDGQESDLDRDDLESNPLLGRDEPDTVTMNRNDKRIIAIFVALIAGVFYGVTFVPVIYIQDHPEKFPGASKNGLTYVFSHFCGIFLTATLIFILYIAYTANRPVVNSRIIGPSLLAGCMWAIAQSSWFIANDSLSQSVTFPIITTMPGVGASLWSVFYFRELTGKRNLQVLTCAILTTITGALLVGISK
ncbi:hypothetical protein KIN20_004159 [Parelaphostrongylus tenuis]|uniref:Transmembrane protein 144 n=1 Tax=Parelaphostrongylus tenuis TaxID=148309 RepID=A0AAD5M2M5_PARTN|nr:hypothetical protein KIN20_004159 [Parelaphostrongylus tenuis]